MNMNPYIFFDGDCAEAVRFYARVLGWRVEAQMTWGESPECDKVPPEYADRIIHACLATGNGVVMASDCPPGDYRPPAGIALAVSPEDSESAERIFAALADGGEVNMPLEETFFAHRFGAVTDRFGIDWMVSVLREEQGCRE
jgi:PhnB protein